MRGRALFGAVDWQQILGDSKAVKCLRPLLRWNSLSFDRKFLCRHNGGLGVGSSVGRAPDF